MDPPLTKGQHMWIIIVFFAVSQKNPWNKRRVTDDFKRYDAYVTSL